MEYRSFRGLPGGAGGEEPTCQCRSCERRRLSPWVGKTPWRTQTHSSVLAWGAPRTEEPAGCSPWGQKESDTADAAQHSARSWFTVLQKFPAYSKVTQLYRIHLSILVQILYPCALFRVVTSSLCYVQ